ncbi:MAG: hypothetical protein VCA36_09265 [Opitutales bacterium]
MKSILLVTILVFSIGTLWGQDAPAEPAPPTAPGDAEEPVVEESEARWSDFLPLNKEMAGDADLPLPFGIGVTILNQKQSMETDSISVTVPDILLTTPLLLGGFEEAGLVDAATPLVTTLDITADRVGTDVDVKLVKLDAWVLPFMNVYGIVGEIEGSNSVVNASVTDGQGESAAENASNALKNNFPATVYDGDLWGIGVVLAFARDRWWGTLDYSYTKADLSISTSEITIKTFSPRVGTTGKLGDMAGAVWIGGMHQDVDEHQTGTSGAIVYDVMQHAEEEWNFLVGGSLDMSEQLNLLIEAGFGEREQVMGSLIFRF